ncbi:MAG: 4-hydroxy-tetrahydrodipicolinate synthase [Lachnospiraceae bacterium]|nr:4-hydroxy-tetrahydrodipicolinate synthase [Lachnospiraceae bacterium]
MAVFKGAGVAIITPMKENLEVDYDAFANIIEEQIQQGTDAIIVCGTTGEASTLSHDEHISVIKYCVEKVAHRIPVIAGTGSNSTDTAIYLSKEAEKVGVDGVLLVTPYYNKATQKGLYEHFKLIAGSIKVPVILYNIPGRTGCTMTPETIIKLCNDVENIVGVKEASGNISAIAKLMAKANGKVDLYSGNDDQIVPILSLGGKGVISVLSNVAPRQTHDICALYFEGKVEESCKKQLEAIELIDALFCEVNPIPVKKAMNLMGKCSDGIRRPLTVMEYSNVERLKAAMENYGILSHSNDSDSCISERLKKEMSESSIR